MEARRIGEVVGYPFLENCKSLIVLKQFDLGPDLAVRRPLYIRISKAPGAGQGFGLQGGS